MGGHGVQQKVKDNASLPVTKFDFVCIKTNFKPVLHAINDRRSFSKTLEAYAGINFPGGIVDANI
jgi:hypothetical protein